MRLLAFPVERFERLAHDSLRLTRLARRFVEMHFVGKEQREYEVPCSSRPKTATASSAPSAPNT